MALELHSSSLIPEHVRVISVSSLDWWFWIKAGMGFTLGVAIVSIVGGIIGNALLGALFTRLLFH